MSAAPARTLSAAGTTYTATETGTVTDPNNPVLAPLTRTDITYDSRRHPVRQAVSANGTTYTVTDSYSDDQGRLVCAAVRMNPAAFGQMPGACAHTTLDPAYGADRIAYNVYDAAGQRLQEVRAYLIQYDGHDRLWISYFPTLNQNWVNWSDYEVYGYDAVGNRISLRKRDGSTLTYQYDQLNRMILKVVPERAGLSSTHTRDVHYGYDLRNAQTYARFDSSSGEGMTNAWDAFGRLTSSTLLMDGASRQLGYEYDSGGRRTRITHPDQRSFVYAMTGAAATR